MAKSTATRGASRASIKRERGDQGDDYGEVLLARVLKADRPEARSRQVEDPFSQLYGIGGAIQPPFDPVRLLNLIEQNAIHSACITAKADDSVGRGWNFEPTKKDVDANVPTQVSEQLEGMVPDLSFTELLNQAVWEREAIGWSAWEVVRDDPADVESEIRAIYPIPAHTIRATKDKNVWVQIRGVEICFFKMFGVDLPYDRRTGKAVQKAQQQQKPVGKGWLFKSGRIVKEEGTAKGFDPASEIIVFKTYSPRSPYYGIPKWISVIPAIAELTAIREFNVSFFESGGTADRIIHVTATDGKAAKALADSITNNLRDAAGRGHVTIVTSGGTDTNVNAQPLNGPQGSAGQRDAQFIRRREDLVKEVLMGHNVPPYRIGWADIGSLGGSAAKEMMRAYKVGSIETNQTIMEDRLNLSLFGDSGLALDGYKWVLEDVDWQETDLDLAFATQGRAAAILTGNEARKVIGQERYEDPAMDRIMSATQLVPVTTSVEAEALKQVISEFKTALEAAIRGTAEQIAPAAPGQEQPAKQPAAPGAKPAAPAPNGNGKGNGATLAGATKLVAPAAERAAAAIA